MNIASSPIKRIIKGAVKTLGFEISRPRPPGPQASPERMLFEALLNIRGAASDATPFLKYCACNIDKAHAQLFQDLLVLYLLEEKRDGYFVEFGAADGLELSNTFLLENEYGWRGIVAEPARCSHQALTRNRTCSKDYRCLWSKSGKKLEFIEAAVRPSLSGLYHNAKPRQDGKQYTVETISLPDLLLAHNAPMGIDYLSVDTEGSEFIILDSFFPSPYEVRVITVEHNYTNQRSDIHRLLTSCGYKQVFKELSMFDDWYIKQ
jgi:FkbM family methyltransferase